MLFLPTERFDMFLIIRFALGDITPKPLSMVFTTPEKAKSYVEKHHAPQDPKWRFYDDDGSYEGVVSGGCVYTVLPVPVDPEA